METIAKLRHSGESRNPEGRCNRAPVAETVASPPRSRVLQWSQDGVVWEGVVAVMGGCSLHHADALRQSLERFGQLRNRAWASVYDYRGLWWS